MFPSLVVSASVILGALAFSTQLGKSSKFLGLGVCFGVEQGARIRNSEIEFSGLCAILPPIVVELFLLYTLVPLLSFLGMVSSSDIFQYQLGHAI